MGDFSCQEVTESAPAFALDILEPAARARVAAHLIRCPGCRETVSGMQDSAARLLDLGEPGTDHEWTDAEWTDHEWAGREWTGDGWAGDGWTGDGWAGDNVDADDDRPPRRRLRVVLSLAAAAVLLVGSTLGPELEQAARSPGDPVATAVLLAAGHPVGAVRFYGGANPGIDVEVRGLPGKGHMSLVLVTREGTARLIGQLVVSRGQADWFGTDPVAVADIEAIVLVDSTRNQVASTASAGSLA